MAEQNSQTLSDSKGMRILTFGASLTEGYTDFGMTFHPYGKSLKKKLSALHPNLKITVDVNGRSGDCVLASLGGNFLNRLQSSCQESKLPKYDLVIFLGGTNDLAYKLNAPNGTQEIFEGLKKCYEHVLQTYSTNLLCLTIPERHIDLSSSKMGIKARDARLKLNSLIASYVESHEAEEPGKPRAMLMDLAKIAPFTPDDNEEDADTRLWSADGLHMTSVGYDFVGEELARFIHDNVLKVVSTEANT